MQEEWLVVRTRSPTLTAIRKERACQGKVYTVWEADRRVLLGTAEHSCHLRHTRHTQVV